MTTRCTPLTIRGRSSPPTPNQAAEVVTGRPYITPSQVACFQRCSLAWHFQYVEHAEPETLSAAMVLGTATHAAVQHHLHSLLAADASPTVEELIDVYREAWEREVAGMPVQYARGETAQTLESTARAMVEAVLSSPHATPEGEILGIEETLSNTLDPDLPDLVGRVDVLSRTADELVVTDLKTARTMWAPQTAEEHGQQLVLYGQAAEPLARELGLQVRLQFLVVTKAKTPKVEALSVTLDEDRILRTRAVLRQVFRAMQAGHVYPSPSPLNCHGCGYQRRCGKWHRSFGSR